MNEVIHADGDWQRLDPRYVTMARRAALLEVAIWCASLGVITALLWWWLDWPLRIKILLTALWVVAVLAMGVIRWIAAAIHYRHASWRLGENALEIHGGAWWRSRARVPLSRIQHTDVTQGPIERMHGLGAVVVYTAGTQHSAVELAGLAFGDAVMVRDHLLRINAPDPV